MLNISTDHFNAFAPTFRLLSAASSKEHPDEYLWIYVEYFTQQNLMPEAVNQTARDIVIGWEKPYWPSAEYIAKLARQKQRSVMDELHGLQGRQEALEDWCEMEGQRRWDERLEMATVWRTAQPERFKKLVRDIDSAIKLLIANGQQWMRESDVYRDAFRMGSAVGGSIREAGVDERKREKLLASERASRAAQYGATGVMVE